MWHGVGVGGDIVSWSGANDERPAGRDGNATAHGATPRWARHPLRCAGAPVADTILASISDGIVALDNEWRLVYANPAATRIWGRDLTPLMGKSIHDSLDIAPDNPFRLAYMASKQNGEPIAFTGYSEVFAAWVDVRGYPHPDGYTILFRAASPERPTARANRRKRARARGDPLDQPAHLRYLARSDPGGRPARRFSPRQPELARHPGLRARRDDRPQRAGIRSPRRSGGHAREHAARAPRPAQAQLRVPL